MHLSPSEWAQMVTAFVAILALFYTATQVKRNTEVSSAQFALELEKMFSAHDDVHTKLRPGGEWSEEGKGPTSPDQWSKLEDYLGLFEHCEVMLKKKLIDFDTFEAVFSYRISNILLNQRIVQTKLIDRPAGWSNFIDLVARLAPRLPDDQVKKVAAQVLERKPGLSATG